jgi:hypothetical protein
MTEHDTAALEPLGYIGWKARNKTIYDFPGLCSPIATKAVSTMKVPGLGGLVAALEPTYAVMRLGEFDAFRRDYSDVAAKYAKIEEFHCRPGLDFRHWGLFFVNAIDCHFVILRRMGPSVSPH